MSDPALPALETLGARIMILGPSNAGKSTLAVALGERLGVAVHHLDLLHHQPHTNWVPRAQAEFAALHAEAVSGDRWVMEGNYMGLFAARAQRATGYIVLGSGRWSALRRYLLRTLLQRSRPGMLEGGQDRLNRNMIRFILVEQPAKRERDLGLARATGLPGIELRSMQELRGLYRAWGLPPPG